MLPAGTPEPLPSLGVRVTVTGLVWNQPAALAGCEEERPALVVGAVVSILTVSVPGVSTLPALSVDQ